MFAVTAAHGKVGGPLLLRLATAGHPVRALVHHPIRGGGADERTNPATAGDPTSSAITCDLTDPASLDRAFDGIDTLYLATPPQLLLARGAAAERAIVDAAVRHGVRRIVKQSVQDTESPSAPRVVRAHREADAYLRDAVGHTILRPSAFMQNFATFEARVRGGFLAMPGRRARVSWIDATDAATAAAAVLTSTDTAHDAADYTLTGPQALSIAQVDALIGTAMGRTVRYLPLPSPLARVAVRTLPIDRDLAREMVDHARWWDSGAGATVTSTFATLTGRQPRTVAEFLTASPIRTT